MPRRKPRNDWRASHEIHRAVVGRVSRGGDVDDIAKDIHEIYVRYGWKAPVPAGLDVSKCRFHTSTALQNRRCPICGWNPYGTET